MRVYEFSDDTQSCLIAWSYPPGPQRVALSALRAGLSVDNVVTLSDTVGTPLPVSADVPIDEFPVFVVSPVDTERPSAPADLIAAAESASEVTLQWSAAVDNTAVTGYRVFRDGAAIAAAPATGYSDRGLAAGTTCTYEVSAVDAQGNESARSDPVTAEIAGVSASVNAPGSSANGVLLLLWLAFFGLVGTVTASML